LFKKNGAHGDVTSGRQTSELQMLFRGQHVKGQGREASQR